MGAEPDGNPDVLELSRAKKVLTPPVLPNGRLECSIEVVRSVLPHRPPFLCLDKVIVLRDRVIGVLEVNPAVCVGFCFRGADDIFFMGTLITEMAIQLLGIYGAQFNELRRLKREFALVEHGIGRFHKSIRASEKVHMELPTDDVHIRGSADSKRFLLEGSNFVAKVDGNTRATVSFVKLLSTIAPVAEPRP